MATRWMWVGLAAVGVALVVALHGCGGGADLEMINVSYDPTRQFYAELNETFVDNWQAEHGQRVRINMSHAGSGKQARSVIDGLQASVVTLALGYDIDAIQQRAGLIQPDWQKRLENNSCPYTSTIVFLVRKGNPKQIHDWPDLLRGNVKIITPDPKTSGGARWNYLAAWGASLRRSLGDFKPLADSSRQDDVARAQAEAQTFVTQMFLRVPTLDSGARGATMTFVQRGIGDVLLAWENEALLAIEELAPGKVEMVVPPVSIRAEPPVAVVDKVVDQLGTRKLAEGYVKYLYTPAAQRLAAKHYYRPAKPEGVPEELLKQFPPIEMFTVEDVFGGWKKAQAEHFDDGGLFDKIYTKR